MDARNNDLLTITTPSDREIVLTRSFKAPRKLVFEAWTKPEHVLRWWGCGALTMPVCEIDLRPGGAWRYVLRSPDGQEFGFHGVYREIVAPERLVHTYIFEPYPDHGALNTVTFEEQLGRTTVTETVLHHSVEGRDGHLNSGMESGAAESLDRLAKLLATMQQAA